MSEDCEDYDLQAGGLGMTLDQAKERYLVVPRGPSIIVVGPDRVGKTTLVKHLSKMLGIPSFKAPNEKEIFKNGGRSSLSFDYTLTHFIDQTGFRFVSDRGYPCEWVYSLVFERETDQDMLLFIDERHAKLGTKILFAFSSEEPAEEDDLVPREKYWDVLDGYKHFVNWTDCEVVTINTSQMLKAYKNGGDISQYVAEEALDLLRFT